MTDANVFTVFTTNKTENGQSLSDVSIFSHNSERYLGF